MGHTPGPWKVGGDCEEGLWVTGPNTSLNVVCDIVAREHRLPASSEDEANAFLIAAAPALLGALKAVVARYGPDATYLESEVWNQARSALALAEPEGER